MTNNEQNNVFPPSLAKIVQAQLPYLRQALDTEEETNLVDKEKFYIAIETLTNKLVELKLDDNDVLEVFKYFTPFTTNSIPLPLTMKEEEWEHLPLQDNSAEQIMFNKRYPGIVKMSSGEIRFYNPFLWIENDEISTGPFADFPGYVTIPNKPMIPMKFIVTVNRKRNEIVDRSFYESYKKMLEEG